jgi:hypothetical protein
MIGRSVEGQGELFPIDPPGWWIKMVAEPDYFDVELARVKKNIARHVFEFCSDNLGMEFHMRDLSGWIQRRNGTAPASPDRILRQLRSDGLVSYTVVNRAQSLYRVDSIKTK